MKRHEEESISHSSVAHLDDVYSALERVIMAWAKCTTDYAEESGDELWYAVDALTSANIAAKFDVPVRPERVALIRNALYGRIGPQNPKARAL
jgi:hypothetical protein